jgi:hypothetical protein
MAEIRSNTIFKTPLPWRHDTPLHAQMGSLSLRYKWSNVENLPMAATPLRVTMQYTADTMDRIVGFYLGGDNNTVANLFNMVENNTGWRYHYLVASGSPYMAQGNIETLPDQIDLTVWFNNEAAANLYLAFYNFEVVPSTLR